MEVTLISAAELSSAAAIIRQGIEPNAEVTEVPAEATVRFRTARSESDLSQLLTRYPRRRAGRAVPRSADRPGGSFHVVCPAGRSRAREGPGRARSGHV